MDKKYEEIQQYIVFNRRNLHQIPEVGTDLPLTRDYICRELNALGIPYKLSSKDSGLVATLGFDRPGKTIALRADMDALPVTEETGLPFASVHSGAMHACGHDAHMAMLLGAAKLLLEKKEELNGSIKLFFQTGEESAIGAELLIDEGCMEKVDAVFGTHIGLIMGKDYPSGTVIAVPGCCMASYDKFVIHVEGKGIHGSSPEGGVDPIHVAAQIVISLQEILAREIKGTEARVLTVCRIEGGQVYNVIPNEAVLEGTIRAVDDKVRKYMAKRIEEIANGIATTFRAKCNVEIVWGAPPVVNDPELAQLVASVAERLIGKEKVITQVPAASMIGEDFAYYLQKKPGAFILLSSADATKATDIGHHNPKFDVDEDVMWEGAALFAGIAEEMLK